MREDGSRLPAEDRPTRLTVRRGEPLTGLVVGLERPNGNVTWLSVNTGFLRRPGESELYGVVSIISDITDRRRDELKLRESEERFRSLTAMSSDFFWETDDSTASSRWSTVRSTPRGWTHHRPGALGSPARTSRRGCLDGAARDHGSAPGVPRLRVRAFVGRRHGALLFDHRRAALRSGGAFLGYRGVGRDVTDIALAREHIATLAYRDALTGLDNRTSLFPALESRSSVRADAPPGWRACSSTWTGSRK